MAMPDQQSNQDAAAALMRLNPAVFAHYATGGAFPVWPHLRLIGERIARCAYAPNSRLIINVPPRHMKSTLATFWSSVWYLNTFPNWNVMLSTHSQTLGQMWGRRIRNELRTNKACSNTSLASDSASAARFNTPDGGGLTVFSVGAAATGHGADWLVVDDPHRSMESTYSRAEREKIHRWWDELYSRLNSGGSAVVIMQRMHPEDLTGYLTGTDGEKWDVVCLPALAEQNDPLGRKPGEALCPSLFSVRDLRRIQRATKSGWFARYQQRPIDLRTGRVYTEFSSTPKVGNVDPSVALVPGHPLHLSIDFNVRPGMHAVVGQFFPAEDCFTAVHELYEEGMDLRAMMRAFESLMAQICSDWNQTANLQFGRGAWPFTELHIFGDASGNSRTMENASVGETHYSLVKAALHRLGFVQDLGAAVGGAKLYRIRVPKANPRIVDRVNAVNAVLCDLDGKRRYRVHPRCVSLLDDFKLLRTGEDGMPDKSDQTLSHSSDAEGYRIHYLRPTLVQRAR